MCNAEFGDCQRKRRLSPNFRTRRLSPKTATVTVAEFGDKLSPNSATIVASVELELSELEYGSQLLPVCREIQYIFRYTFENY